MRELTCLADQSTFVDFGLGERRRVFAPLLGDGIFTQDGDAWASSRGVLKRAFRCKDNQVLASIEDAVDKLVAQIFGNSVVDLQPLFFRFTLDTTSYLLFGHTLDEFESELGGDSAASFAAAFDEAQDFLARRGRLGPFYWMIDGSGFRETCARVHGYIDKAIHLALMESQSEDEKAGKCFLDALVERTTNRKVLREQCLNVLLAGRDTTACLLSWTLYDFHFCQWWRCDKLLTTDTVGCLREIQPSSTAVAKKLLSCVRPTAKSRVTGSNA